MSGGCVGVEALTAGPAALLDGQLQTLLESWNPLDCLLCRQELAQPVRLPCHHSFCRHCLAERSKCPACDLVIEGELEDDHMINFLIETSHESADVCANCDKISQPMHFCETCHQPLCNSCKENTHQAKMFAAHRIVPLEERARVRGRGVCAEHSEPFILFSTDTRELVCINCFKGASLESRHHFVDLDVAHKMGCEKLDKVTTKLKAFQQDVKEQMQLRRRLLNELEDSFKAQSAQVRQICQQMIDGLMQVRDRLLQELDTDRGTRESHFNDQLKQLCAMLPSVYLYLLSSSIFCASASKIDFLDSAHDLIKRIQALTGDGGQLSKPLFTGQLSSDSREEYARALEPFLGLSSLLLTRRGGPDGNGVDCSGTVSPRRCSRRSGSGYVNCPNALAMSKYQLIVDLAGAFGEEFARIETPVRLLAHQMSALTKETQELHRDLTLRRCLIDKVRVNELIARCVDVDTKLAAHSALIQDAQPQLQHIWQEQLDRVRRQQQLFREKVEQTVQLREDARHVSAVARQLEPFALSLAAAASLIDPRRCHPPDPAPMERICLEINTIAPDSQHRIEAIEKEEQNRKLVQEQKKREETNELMSAKRQLKITKEHRKAGKAAGVESGVVRTVGRDRSRGGTDHALMSPTKRKDRSSPAVSPRPVSDDQSSVTDEFESSMDDSFEFTAPEATASVEIVTRREIRLLRSKTIHAPRQSSTTSAPSIPVSCSLPESDGHHLESSMAGLRLEQSALSSGNSNATQPPKPPSVPASVFAVNAGSVRPATWRAREMVLESLKQMVPLVNVGATKSPDRQLPNDGDEQQQG